MSHGQSANVVPPPTLDLGCVFQVDMYQFVDESPPAEYTIEQLVAALEATLTLQELEITDLAVFMECATPEHIRRVIEPLCLCLANLRRQNKSIHSGN